MFDIKSFKAYSISNILIALCFIVTSIVISIPEYYIYGINSVFLIQGYIEIFIFQLFSGVFMHGGILHLLSNCIFIYLFGNIVENLIGVKKYILLFIFSVIITGITLILLTNGNTVGISGFAMTLLGFYTIRLYKIGNPDYRGGITAIIINIAIGFTPGISLIGHLFGVIVGVIYGLIYRK